MWTFFLQNWFFSPKIWFFSAITIMVRTYLIFWETEQIKHIKIEKYLEAVPLKENLLYYVIIIFPGGILSPMYTVVNICNTIGWMFWRFVNTGNGGIRKLDGNYGNICHYLSSDHICFPLLPPPLPPVHCTEIFFWKSNKPKKYSNLSS